MFFVRRHSGFVLVIAFLMVGTLPACTAWHTTSLQPRRFNSRNSPEQVRLTLNTGAELDATHPALVGDSLIWVTRWGAGPGDSLRSAVLASSVQRAEVHGLDAPKTLGLLALVGGVAWGLVAAWNSLIAGFGNMAR